MPFSTLCKIENMHISYFALVTTCNSSSTVKTCFVQHPTTVLFFNQHRNIDVNLSGNFHRMFKIPQILDDYSSCGSTQVNGCLIMIMVLCTFHWFMHLQISFIPGINISWYFRYQQQKAWMLTFEQQFLRIYILLFATVLCYVTYIYL